MTLLFEASMLLVSQLPEVSWRGLNDQVEILAGRGDEVYQLTMERTDASLPYQRGILFSRTDLAVEPQIFIALHHLSLLRLVYASHGIFS